jgi:single-strand DNA-binding protein
MLNNAVIMGRLTKDPELKTTANGISVTSFTIAVDRKFNKQGEEKQADFIDIIAWRGTAEFISKYFRKGSMIAVQGSIQTRMYEDKNGNKRKAVEVLADEVSFCGDKNINAAPAPTTPTITPSDEEYRDIPEDDLPF